MRELGGLNILVNNAAYHIESQDFREISPEQLDNTFRTNVHAYFWMAQAAVDHVRAGDVIINTGSVVAAMPYLHLMDYAATKAANLNFTRNLAAALAPNGIRVNCVAPGPVWTPLIAATRDEDFVGEFGADTYWKRPAQPIELATSFVFLASADSRCFIGEVLCPSGFPTTSRCRTHAGRIPHWSRRDRRGGKCGANDVPEAPRVCRRLQFSKLERLQESLLNPLGGRTRQDDPPAASFAGPGPSRLAATLAPMPATARLRGLARRLLMVGCHVADQQRHLPLCPAARRRLRPRCRARGRCGHRW